MTDFERREQMEKTLEAMNRLQQQSAAIYGEVMRMSAKISEALKSKDTLDLVAQALAVEDMEVETTDDLDIF
jgi:hypothetical protein